MRTSVLHILIAKSFKRYRTRNSPQGEKGPRNTKVTEQADLTESQPGRSSLYCWETQSTRNYPQRLDCRSSTLQLSKCVLFLWILPILDSILPPRSFMRLSTQGLSFLTTLAKFRAKFPNNPGQNPSPILGTLLSPYFIPIILWQTSQACRSYELRPTFYVRTTDIWGWILVTAPCDSPKAITTTEVPRHYQHPLSLAAGEPGRTQIRNSPEQAPPLTMLCLYSTYFL